MFGINIFTITHVQLCNLHCTIEPDIKCDNTGIKYTILISSPELCTLTSITLYLVLQEACIVAFFRADKVCNECHPISKLWGFHSQILRGTPRGRKSSLRFISYIDLLLHNIMLTCVKCAFLLGMISISAFRAHLLLSLPSFKNMLGS